MESSTSQPSEYIENESSSGMDEPSRHRWVDQFRGVLFVFYLIASITGLLSANIRGAEFPVGPTWLSFGYEWIDFYPAMITLVDVGSLLFMFTLGMSVVISFQKKRKEKGDFFAWIMVLTRVVVFLWIGQVLWIDLEQFLLNDIILLATWGVITIVSAVLRNTRYKNNRVSIVIGLIWSMISVVIWFFKFDMNLWFFLFGNEFAYLAWATLFATTCVFLIQNPDFRIIVPIVLVGVQFYLWERLQEWSVSLFVGTSFKTVFMVPFEVLGLSAAAITGTCVWNWLKMDPNKPQVGTRKRLIPLMSITFIGQFIIDFFQTGDSRGMNPSVIFLGISLSVGLSMLAHAIDVYYKFNLPIFTYLGKNAFFLLVLNGFLMIPYRLIWPGGGQDFRNMVSQWFDVSPTHTLVNFAGLLAFLVPIGVIFIVAWGLGRFHLQIKTEGFIWKKSK